MEEEKIDRYKNAWMEREKALPTKATFSSPSLYALAAATMHGKRRREGGRETDSWLHALSNTTTKS